ALELPVLARVELDETVALAERTAPDHDRFGLVESHGLTLRRQQEPELISEGGRAPLPRPPPRNRLRRQSRRSNRGTSCTVAIPTPPYDVSRNPNCCRRGAVPPFRDLPPRIDCAGKAGARTAARHVPLPFRRNLTTSAGTRIPAGPSHHAASCPPPPP